VKSADHVIDLGPEGGAGGGKIVAAGTPEEVAANRNSATGKFLAELFAAEKARQIRSEAV
jgi:excinuclease ABC subunit A